MRLALFINRLKNPLKITLAASLTFSACAQTNNSHTKNVSNTSLSQVQTLELDKSTEELKGYLETLKLYDVNTVRGSTHNERLKSQDWLNQNMADFLIEHGVNKNKLLKIAGNDDGVMNLLGRRVRFEVRFEDYLRLAEIAVIARVADAVPNSPMTFAGPGFYNLDVTDILSATLDFENIVVMNATTSHSQMLHTGKECVFFLSPTYTKRYVAPDKEYPNLPDFLRDALPDNFLTSRFSTYCSPDGETFARESGSIGGPDEMTRSEIFGLAKTIP